MGTDNDVGQPEFRSEGWYADRAAEAKANLTDVGRRRHDQLAAAAGVDVDTLSARAQNFLVWLAGWSEHMVEPAIELLDAARVGQQSVLADGRADVVDGQAPGQDAFWCKCGHGESSHQVDGATGNRTGSCLAPFGRPRPALVGGCGCISFDLATRVDSGAA